MKKILFLLSFLPLIAYSQTKLNHMPIGSTIETDHEQKRLSSIPSYGDKANAERVSVKLQIEENRRQRQMRARADILFDDLDKDQNQQLDITEARAFFSHDQTLSIAKIDKAFKHRSQDGGNSLSRILFYSFLHDLYPKTIDFITKVH